MLRLLAIFVLFPFHLLMAQRNITITINSLPEYHSSGSNVYIAGSFNGWNPQDEKYKFSFTEGKYSITLPLADGSYEYKITRGGWDKVECRKGGGVIENRSLKVAADEQIHITVEEWQDRYPSAQTRKSTASKNVCIVDTAFLIPQLKRTRRVWIYLPAEYCANETDRYPVLYMHDGQNIFDDVTSFSGEWGVDEFMDSLTSHKCIVVGIDHGGSKRLNEYNPYDNERFGKGEGKLYADFIVKTLKPYIDRHYRTKRDKKSTFIAGSSMGGLISLYTVLEHPKVFGGAGIFSPSFWITGSQIYEDIRKKGKKVNANLYFYAGKEEGESMVPDMLKAFEAMGAVSSSKMKSVIRHGAKHNEAYWRKEFPGGYYWMLEGREVNTEQ